MPRPGPHDHDHSCRPGDPLRRGGGHGAVVSPDDLPSVAGFLIARILAGPSGFGLIGTTHHVEQAAEIGVVLLLFTIGIKLSLSELRRIFHLLVIGGGLQVGLTILTVALLGSLVGTSLSEGVLRGRSGATILAIKRGDDVYPNPDPVWELREEDVVLTLETPEQLKAAARLFESK